MAPEKSRAISFDEAKVIARSGPDRVVVSPEGDAVPLKEALLKGCITDYIFVRKDGWKLGCPFYLERVAHDLWVGDWILVYEVVSDHYMAYPLYLAIR